MRDFDAIIIGAGPGWSITRWAKRKLIDGLSEQSNCLANYLQLQFQPPPLKYFTSHPVNDIKKMEGL